MKKVLGIGSGENQMSLRNARAILAAVGAVFSSALFAAAAHADSLDVGAERIIRLNPASTYLSGCFPPCLCPILVQQGVAGTFTVTFEASAAVSFDSPPVPIGGDECLPVNVAAVSTWGLIVLGLLMAVSATVIAAPAAPTGADAT